MSSQDLVDQLRAAVVDGRARSVSACVEHAVRGQLAAETDFDAIVEEMLIATGGPPTDAERAEQLRCWEARRRDSARPDRTRGCRIRHRGARCRRTR